MSERTTKDSNRSTNGKAKARVTTARRRSEPRLGELEFSEWYETPVFEPSNEERMETMATGGRAPSRFVARVVLAAGARRERRRAERQHQEPEPEEDVQSAAESAAPAEPEATPEPVAVAAAVVAEPVAEPVAAKSLGNPAEPILEANPEAPPLLTVDVDPQLPEPEPAVATAPAGPSEPEPVLIPELADRPGWRQKASDLLDRWAEKEVAVATKLDEALAPAIPWGGHKKPAHSRRHRSS